MNLGTKSILFGVHQFVWHPITVTLAWRKLYGEWPTWREFVCIIVHDWGYWGSIDIDGDEGRLHPWTGAAIAGYLFGPRYHALVLLHSRELGKIMHVEPSKLCWADKASLCFDPAWLYLPRAWATGELREYIANARRSQFIHEWEGAHVWHYKLQQRMWKLAVEKSQQFKNAA